MATVALNPILAGLRGRLGNTVFRQLAGQTIAAAYSVASPTCSPAQASYRNAFGYLATNYPDWSRLTNDLLHPNPKHFFGVEVGPLKHSNMQRARKGLPIHPHLPVPTRQILWLPHLRLPHSPWTVDITWQCTNPHPADTLSIIHWPYLQPHLEAWLPHVCLTSSCHYSLAGLTPLTLYQIQLINYGHDRAAFETREGILIQLPGGS